MIKVIEFPEVPINLPRPWLVTPDLFSTGWEDTLGLEDLNGTIIVSELLSGAIPPGYWDWYSMVVAFSDFCFLEIDHDRYDPAILVKYLSSFTLEKLIIHSSRKNADEYCRVARIQTVRTPAHALSIFEPKPMER